MLYPNKTIVEVAVDSYEMAVAAEEAGADRIELCVALSEGGISPPLSLVQKVCEAITIPVHVMVRPRGGDFLYSEVEFEMMKKSIHHYSKAGAKGLVFGILKEDGTIDKVRCKELMDLSFTKKIVFHRAFDMTADPFLAMEEIIALGVHTILTSGQRQTAEDGLELLKELVKRSVNRINIMAGSGVNAHNVPLLYEAGIRTFHFTARKKVDGNMKYRNDLLQSMGSGTTYSEYDKFVFDAEKLKDVINVIKTL